MSGQPPAFDQDAKNRFAANFHPGRWLDRRQVDVPSLTALSGCYERKDTVSGRWHSPDFHYFDLCLATRPSNSLGCFENCSWDRQAMGEIFFIPAGHGYYGEGGSAQQRNLFVFLNANDLPEDEGLMGGNLPSPLLRDCLNLRNGRIKFLLTQIARELYNPGFASEIMLEGLGTTLLVETLRLLQHKRARQQNCGGLAPKLLCRIEERVREGETLPSLNELAEICSLSRRHLMRAFREETGQTIGEFIQALMMEKARYTLAHTDKPVGIIADEVGFSTPAAFSAAFRRAHGESPRSYRTHQRTFRNWHLPEPRKR